MVKLMDLFDNTYRLLHKSFEHLRGEFHILETNIPVEKQMEYFRYSEIVRRQKEKPTVEEAIDILDNRYTTDNEKKCAMTLLAISGDVKAYRALELYSPYIEYYVEHLKDWMELALLQAKITLESEFSDEKQIFISTGLGGKGEMLRLYAFFKSNNLRPFSPYQVQLIEKEFPFFINEACGVIEKIEVFENYFTLLFLVNIKSDIKYLLENAVIECNQYGNFIDCSFIVTNVKVFDEEEIKRELRGK